MNDLVSVIVPAYNSEKTIGKCLESLVKQTLLRLQIIVVNDGSKDATGDIINEWAQKYPERIKAVHQENTGVWNARKCGIAEAKGSYIGFCDADDVVMEDMYEILYNSITRNNSQVAVCAYQRYVHLEALGDAEMTSFGDVTLSISARNLGEIAVINTALWNKLFQADVIKKGIEFQKAPKIAEDMMLFLSIIPYVNNISFISKPLYCYMIYEESAMNSIKQEDAERTMAAMLYLKKQMPEEYGNLVDIMAFIHIGISLPVGLANGGLMKSSKEFKVFQSYLDEHFSGWRNSRYLKLRYILNHNFAMTKPWFVQKIYKLHLFPLFVKVYSVVIRHFKVNLKW